MVSRGWCPGEGPTGRLGIAARVMSPLAQQSAFAAFRL